MNRFPVLALGALLFAGGCAPKFLIADYFIPQSDKTVRTSLKFAGSAGEDANLVHYYMQVCDLVDGKATNCKSTRVLENVLAVDFWNTGY
jgi:hypothetical protein